MFYWTKNYWSGASDNELSTNANVNPPIQADMQTPLATNIQQTSFLNINEKPLMTMEAKFQYLIVT